MDFDLDDDEHALAESIRAICDARFSLTRLQEIAASDTPLPYDQPGWMSLADAGVFSLQVPEARGGVGLGMGASSVVFEELGRSLVPGPIVQTHLAARDLYDAVEGASDGKAVVSGLIVPEGSIEDDGSLTERMVNPLLVPHLSVSEYVVVAGPEGLELVKTASLNADEIRNPLDPLTRLWRTDQVPRGELVADSKGASRWLRDQSILTASMLVGISARCVELAVEYAKQREQFGRPIGSFQAVKHICADMLVRAEVSRSAVQAAAVTVDQPDVGDPERAAAGATLLAADAAVLNAKAAIQVHGGMGFTWEVPAHLFLMRSKVLTSGLNSKATMSELVAGLY